ncbi:MAG: hypothetical protein A3G94_06245 [Deltaproteobacteria bacterium RIFCSPLOWO2_12_FULL_60_16]|nr:MAG: hypothetical protein A3G94_06245 [Deltaproteobacteria bacterium RIFCSPLOWO2_12_FULL_60_16]
MKKRVLLAEDHPDTVEVVKFGLESLGYDVEVAENGLEAVKKAAARRPDLIVMDMMMPVMDGLQATAQIRQNPRTKDIPVLAATALGSLGDQERFLTSGCNGYISKPFTCRQLDAAIQRLFNSHTPRT